MQNIKIFFTLEKKDQLIFFMQFTVIFNFIVAITKFFLSIFTHSLWFGVNAGFGFVLVSSKLLTIRKYRKIKVILDEYIKRKEEYKIYLQNGILLILLGIMYFFVSSYMYFNGTNTNMHEYITYLVALIAFYSIGTAIYGIVKYKRSTEPIVKGIKITNFASALTSIVLTQVVLLDTFSKNYDSRINGYTGIGVSFIIILLGLYMILGMNKTIKSIE